MTTTPIPIVNEYSAAGKQKRIRTILMHPRAVQLNMTDRAVLRKVASYERRFDGCRLSQAKIGKQVGLSSREQVNRVLGKLERLGFIVREQERRPNGSLSTCKITLSDAFIRQVLGLEPMTECHTVGTDEGTAFVVSPGEKSHLAMSHGMSHGMSQLEVEANASTVGRESYGLSTGTCKEASSSLESETAYAFPTESSSQSEQGLLAQSDSMNPPSLGEEIPHSDKGVALTPLRNPWAASSDDTPREPWYASRVRHLQGIVRGGDECVHYGPTKRVEAFRDLMYLWDGIDSGKVLALATSSLWT